MRRPPEFIDVTEANEAELKGRAMREPHILNGLMYAAGGSQFELLDGAQMAFPWPDAITELGQLAGDAERELRGEPFPAWPFHRLRLEPGDIVIVKCGVPEGTPASYTEKMLEACKKVFRKALDAAGYGEEIQTIFTAQSIDISVIAGSADRKVAP